MPDPITLTFLSAVTEAVFGHLLQQAEPRLRTWLKKEPARLAFQAAFLRAYKTYVDQRPQWAASLLDATFFTRDDVAGELSKLLTRAPGAEGRPDVEALAQAWTDYFPTADAGVLEARQAEAAAVLQDFTASLESELGKEEALQPLYDSRALERIAASAESMEAAAARMTPALQRNVTVERDLVNSIIVTGDRNTINYFMAPARTLRTDYSDRVENFILEYLGTPDAPVPFGGRDREIRQLSAWLADEESAPRLLLTAPAGRGKSALLVRWLAGLRGREDLHVIFAPVSIRFRTNLYDVTFAILAHQLACIYGKEPPGVDEPPEVWRGMVSQLLREPPPDGHGLLLVMDGLDEAAGWEPGPDLFPGQLAPGVRIVASARLTAQRPTADDWLRGLGWDRPHSARTFSLAGLDRAGLTDVLVRMGAPLDQLGRDVDIVAELHRLTGGDPLLVRFYVEDLWLKKDAAARLRPADLRHLEPGYKGYFKRWWEDQRQLWKQTGADAALRERSTREVLSLLACALGALTQADLLALASPEADLDPWTLEEALCPLSRFIVGDRRNGFSLAHPKLGEFFREEILLDQVPAIEARFVAWGRETLAELARGERSPEDTPIYLLEYLSLHLQAADDFDALATLVESPAWYEASGYHDPSLQLFARDVERAIEMAEARDLDALPHVVAWSLLLASVRSRATRVPVEALETMVLLGESDRALRYAELITDPKQRIDAYRRIGLRLHEQGRDDEAHRVLERALEVVNDVVSSRMRSEALKGVAAAMAEAGDSAGALAVTEGIADGFCRAEALSGVVAAMTEMGDLEGLQRALAVAAGIVDDRWRVDALSRMAVAMARTCDLEGAKELLEGVLVEAEDIVDDNSRALALSNVATAMGQVGDSEQAKGILRDALATADSAPHIGALWGVATDRWRVDALSSVAAAIAQAGDLEGSKNILAQALVMTKRITDSSRKAEALSNVAVTMIQMGDREGAREILKDALARAKGITDSRQKAETLSSVAVTMIQIGDQEGARETLKDALATAKIVADNIWRAEALSNVAMLMAQAGGLEEATRTLKSALTTIERAVYDHIYDHRWAMVALWRVNALSAMALVIAQAGDLKCLIRALALTKDVNDGVWRTEILTAVASAMVTVGDLEKAREGAKEALAALEGVFDNRWQAAMLWRVASAMAQAGDLEGLKCALTTAEDIVDDSHRSYALSGMATAMAEAGDWEGVKAALTTVHDQSRERVLSDVVKAVMQTGNLESLEKVLAVAKSIADDQSQTVFSEVAMAEALTGGLAFIAFEDCRLQALWDIVAAMIQGGVEEALAVAEGIVEDRWRAEALLDVAVVIILVDELENPGVILKNMWLSERDKTVDSFRAFALWKLAMTMAPMGEPERIGDILEKVLSTAKNITDDCGRAGVLTRMASIMVLTGELERAEDILEKAVSTAKNVTDDYLRAEVLTRVAPVIAQAGKREEAKDILKCVLAAKSSSRAQALLKVAAVTAQVGDLEETREFLKSALALATNIGFEDDRMMILSDVAVAMATTGDLEGLQGALEATGGHNRPLASQSVVGRDVSHGGGGRQGTAIILDAGSLCPGAPARQG